MVTPEQLEKAATQDLIDELNRRGEMPSPDINMFSNNELADALGVDLNADDDVNWGHFYELIMAGHAEQAVVDFKRTVEKKTGRIIV